MKRDLNIKTLSVALLLSLVSVNIINTNETPIIIDVIKQTYQENDPDGQKRIKADHFISKQIKDLISNKIADPTEVDEFGMTPLMWAARNDAKKTVNTLLKNKSVQKTINQKDNFGNTALLHAILASEGTLPDNYKSVISRLLDYNADANLSNYEGKTPLMYAVQTGNPGVVDTLFSYGDAKITDRVLGEAKTKRAKELLEFLQKHAEKYRLDPHSPSGYEGKLEKIVKQPMDPSNVRVGGGPREKEPYRREGQ